MKVRGMFARVGNREVEARFACRCVTRQLDTRSKPSDLLKSILAQVYLLPHRSP